MTSDERQPLFDDAEEDIDVSKFRAKKPRQAADPNDVKDVARDIGFTSREPGGRKRTGRTAQINLKTKQPVIDRLSAIANAHDWNKALVFERAVSALEDALEAGVDPKSLDRD